jgi:hypothetical protein
MVEWYIPEHEISAVQAFAGSLHPRASFGSSTRSQLAVIGLHVVSAKAVYVVAVTTRIKMTTDIVHIHILLCWMRRSIHATLILVNVTLHMTRNPEM